MKMSRDCRWQTVLIFITIIITTPDILIAQTKSKDTGQIKTVTYAGKWEYLVISFGKTLFADPISEPELKQIGLSKLLPYAQAGIVSAHEAGTTQRQMDKLGQYGWELVAVVGAIGGDQEMVFKRLYDASRSEKEAALIMEEGRLLVKEKKDILDELSKTISDDIIDLDAKEVQDKASHEAKIVKQQIMSEKGIEIKNVNIKASQNYKGDFSADIEIIIDGSKSLLSSNTYRKSEAKAYAKSIANRLRDTISLTSDRYSSPELEAVAGNVKISVIIILSYKGKEENIASARTGGKRDWSAETLRQKKNN